MRRLYTSRAGLNETGALEGAEGLPLEGDLLLAPSDEGPALSPYAAELAGAGAATLPGDALAEDERALRRAAELETLGRRRDAISVLRQLVTEHPELEEPRRRLARLLEATGDPEEALVILTAGLERGVATTALRIERGALLGRLSRHAEAEQDLREALGTAPDAPAAHLHLGVSLVRRGRIAEGLPHLRRAATLAPEDPDAAFHLGEALYHEGDLEQALSALEQAAALGARDARTYSLLGRLLDRLGRTDEAMAMHRKARDASSR